MHLSVESILGGTLKIGIVVRKVMSVYLKRDLSAFSDVAMFDFTSLFSAQCSIRLVERNDQRLIMSIVGDSLHEVSPVSQFNSSANN